MPRQQAEVKLHPPLRSSVLFRLAHRATACPHRIALLPPRVLSAWWRPLPAPCTGLQDGAHSSAVGCSLQRSFPRRRGAAAQSLRRGGCMQTRTAAAAALRADGRAGVVTQAARCEADTPPLFAFSSASRLTRSVCIQLPWRRATCSRPSTRRSAAIVARSHTPLTKSSTRAKTVRPACTLWRRAPVGGERVSPALLCRPAAVLCGRRRRL